jgi:hypothetical protein
LVHLYGRVGLIRLRQNSGFLGAGRKEAGSFAH